MKLYLFLFVRYNFWMQMLIIQEIQVKMAMRCHITHFIMATMKKLEMTRFGKDVEKSKPL
jgi:hypothetical protein